MKFSYLKKTSLAHLRRRELVERGLTKYDLLSYLRYLAYRVKWPILFKFSTRLIVIVEVALLHQKFSYNIFGDLTLYLFIIFVSRGILRGIIQYYRTSLMPLVVARNWSLFNIELSKALLINLTCSLAFALSISAACMIFDFSDRLNLYFAISWCLLIPIEQLTAQLWSAVYLNQRLPRSFSIIMSCRLLPIVSILLFTNLLGPFAYIIAIFVGRASERLYLSTLAIKVLNYKFTLKKNSDGGILAIIKQFVRNKLARRYIYFNAVMPCYFLGLGLIIFNRDLNYWVSNIIYFFILNFITFLTTQISRSVLFDIYSILRKGSLQKANYLVRRILALSLGSSIFLATSFVFLILYSQTFYFFVPGALEQFLLILPLAVIAHTLFFTIHTQIQSASVDRYHYQSITLIFLFFGLPLQLFLLQYFLANLQLIYLIEIFLLFAASIVLQANLNFQLSPFFLRHIKSQRRALPMVSAEVLQLQLRAKYIKTGKAHLYLVTFFERDLRPDKILSALPKTKEILIAPYAGGTYLVSSVNPYQRADFCNLSLLDFMEINLETDLKETIGNISKFLSQAQSIKSSFKKIQNKLDLSTEDRNNILKIAQAEHCPLTAIPLLKSLPTIEIRNNQITYKLKSSIKLYDFALNAYFQPSKYIAEIPQGALLSIKKSNKHYYFIDASMLASQQISILQKQIFLFNQFCYFQNIINADFYYEANLKDYLIAQRVINPDTQRTKTSKKVNIANFNFYNHKLV